VQLNVAAPTLGRQFELDELRFTAPGPVMVIKNQQQVISREQIVAAIAFNQAVQLGFG
jgi:hypothetical protein